MPSRSLIAHFAAALVVFGLLIWDPSGGFKKLSYAVEDSYQVNSPIPMPEPKTPVWFVEIDEKSLDAYGQWPWPRTDLAEALIGLYERGATAVALDIIQAEPDRTSPSLLADRLGDQTQALTNDYGYLDWDEFFADVLAQTPTVLALAAVEEMQGQYASKSAWAHIGNRPSLFDHQGTAGPLPAFSERASGIGHVSISPDDDGLVRQIPLMLQAHGELFLALGPELLRVAVGANTSVTKADINGLNTIKVGAYEIPVNPAGELRLAYSALDNVRRIGLADALAPGGPDLSQSLILLGPSALGLKDFHDTPVSLSTPGPLFHVAALEQILSDTYLVRPYWSRLAEIASALVLGLIALGLALRRSIAISGMAAIACLGSIFGAAWWAYLTHCWILDYSFGMAFVGICFAQGSLSKLVIEESGKREIRKAFASYLAPAVVDSISDDPSKLELGGETQELTIMFADLRGFTTLSESYKDDPQALTKLVNRVMTPMSDAVINQGGTIDKYLGDCLMAFWNAPIPVNEHPDKAVAAAQAIQQGMDWLNGELKKDNPDAGELRMAIGVNTGPVVVGNFGSNQRFDYTCIGDPVNLASRLEGLCRFYDVDILIGENTVDQLEKRERWILIPVDRVRVKGKVEPILVYWLAGEATDPELRGLAELHGQMQNAYWAQDWSACLEVLDRLDSADRYPTQLVGVYRDRVDQYKKAPPGENWDGVYTALTK